MRQAQKLLEDQDSISDGFLILLAMAGGTGSGVGSKITESIRDEFGPKTPLIAHATWPYENGEVVVQSYNTLLTLATLLKNSDGIIFHSNTVVNEILQNRFDLKVGKKNHKLIFNFSQFLFRMLNFLI